MKRKRMKRLTQQEILDRVYLHLLTQKVPCIKYGIKRYRLIDQNLCSLVGCLIPVKVYHSLHLDFLKSIEMSGAGELYKINGLGFLRGHSKLLDEIDMLDLVACANSNPHILGFSYFEHCKASIEQLYEERTLTPSEYIKNYLLLQ